MTYKLIKLNTARNAIRYIIRAFSIKEIYIPYYICPALRSAVFKEKCKISYYHIDSSFSPIQKFPKNAFILYVNYFGVCSDIVNKLADEYNNLIVDNAHSFYSNPSGIASFNSLRKFFPVLRDGSFLYIKSDFDIKFTKDNYFYEPVLLNEKDFLLNELRLNSEDIKYTSDSTLNALYNIDLEKEKQKRIENLQYWQKRFKGIININNNEVPFSFPYFCQTEKVANDIVNQLKNENIVIYRYWNNLPDSFPEKFFYTNLVSIPLS